jgi:hypothetical protein
MTQSSAAYRRKDIDEVAARGVMGAILRGGGAFQSWVKPTEAAGGAQEAHRRWPEGRSEQGASKANDAPPGLRIALFLG